MRWLEPCLGASRRMLRSGGRVTRRWCRRRGGSFQHHANIHTHVVLCCAALCYAVFLVVLALCLYLYL